MKLFVPLVSQYRNFNKRMDVYKVAQGGHLPDVIFRIKIRLQLQITNCLKPKQAMCLHENFKKPLS